MKKLITLFFLIYSSFLLAQNYKAINPNRALYFTDTMTNIFAIKIDSIDVVNNDTNYYSFKTLRPDTAIGPWDSCEYHIDDSWMGRKVIIKPDGYNIFINENYDSICVNTLANLGDTFLLYTYPNNDYIKAIVTNIDTSTILGTLDSVKTYSLITNNTSFSLTPSEIKIGKESGLINMFSFFKFPNGNKSLYYQNNYPSYLIYRYNSYKFNYKLVGKSNPKVGITKLTNREVYDYEIGDEFSSQKDDRPFPALNYKRVENKYYSTNGDTVFYEMERHREYYTVVTYPDFYIDTLFIPTDTVLIYITDLDDYVTNAYPEQHHYNDSALYNHHYTILNTGSCSGIPYVREASRILQYDPSDYAQPFYQSECFHEGFEPAGISTTYQNGNGIFLVGSTGPNDGQEWTETTSYQKNGVTCGTIITAITALEKHSPSFTIYPNPASRIFSYVFNSGGKNILQIFDISGRLALEKLNLNFEGDINISDLNPGIYFVKISNGNNTSTQKLIIH